MPCFHCMVRLGSTELSFDFPFKNGSPQNCRCNEWKDLKRRGHRPLLLCIRATLKISERILLTLEVYQLQWKKLNQEKHLVPKALRGEPSRTVQWKCSRSCIFRLWTDWPSYIFLSLLSRHRAREQHGFSFEWAWCCLCFPLNRRGLSQRGQQVKRALF